MSMEFYVEVLNDQHTPRIGLKTMITPEYIINNQGGEYVGIKTNCPVKAGWFETVEMMDQENPAILIWKPNLPKWAHANERERAHQEMLDVVNNNLELSVILERLSGSEIQLYSLANHTGSVHGDMNEIINLEEAVGIKAISTMPIGKKLKRLGIFGVSRGAFARSFMHDEEDWAKKTLKIHKRPQADGALWIDRDYARDLCEMAGVELTEQTTRLQLWYLTPQGMIKGMAMVQRPEAEAPADAWIEGNNALILAPEESVDQGFVSTQAHICKVIPHEVQMNPPTLKAFDGLLRMPELLKHIDYTEVCDVMRKWFEQIDKESEDQARQTEIMDMDMDLLLEDTEEAADLTRMVTAIERRMYNEPLLKFSKIMGGGYYSCPEGVEAGTGQIYRSLDSRRRRWNNYRQEDGTLDAALPGAYVSAVRAYWTDPLYAGITEPALGHVRILWQYAHGKLEVDGFVMNSIDMMSADVRYRSDGGDLDDLLDGVLMSHKESGINYLWLVRNPTSWGGGWFLKVNDSDFDLLIGKGYHSYSLCNMYEVNELAEISMRDGLQVKWYR